MKFAFLFAAALAYSLCDPTNYPYQGQNITIQLVQSATKVLILGNLTSSIPSLSGTIQVIDGCTFQVRNLDLNASAAFNFEWYGAFKSGVETAVSLSETPVQRSNRASPAQTFTFKRNAGSAVSFLDFDQFRLFETRSLSVVATADLPPNPRVSPPSGRNPTGSNPTTAGSPPGGNNGGFGMNPSALLYSSLMMIFL